MRRYDVNSFDLLKQMLDDCKDDDPNLPWQSYPCMEWPRSKKTFGYGAVWFDGRLYEAHRLACLLSGGKLDGGLYALHKCDNPPCFRPVHLYAGTCADNRRDCVTRQRDNRTNRVRGEAGAGSKLREVQVREIITKFANGSTKSELMREFNVSHRLIRNILAGTAWKHVQR